MKKKIYSEPKISVFHIRIEQGFAGSNSYGRDPNDHHDGDGRPFGPGDPGHGDGPFGPGPGDPGRGHFGGEQF